MIAFLLALSIAFLWASVRAFRRAHRPAMATAWLLLSLGTCSTAGHLLPPKPDPELAQMLETAKRPAPASSAASPPGEAPVPPRAGMVGISAVTGAASGGPTSTGRSPEPATTPSAEQKRRETMYLSAHAGCRVPDVYTEFRTRDKEAIARRVAREYREQYQAVAYAGCLDALRGRPSQVPYPE